MTTIIQQFEFFLSSVSYTKALNTAHG